MGQLVLRKKKIEFPSSQYLAGLLLNYIKSLREISFSFFFFFKQTGNLCFSFTSAQWSCPNFPWIWHRVNLVPFYYYVRRYHGNWNLKLFFLNESPARSCNTTPRFPRQQEQAEESSCGWVGRVLISCWALYLRTGRATAFPIWKKKKTKKKLLSSSSSCFLLLFDEGARSSYFNVC